MSSPGEPFVLEPSPPPAAAPAWRPSGSTLARESAWNDYATAAAELDLQALELDTRAALEETRKALQASGYDPSHATREATALAEDFRAAELVARRLTPQRARKALQSPHRSRVVRAALERRAALGSEKTPAERLILTTRKSTTRCEKRKVLVICGCGGALVDGGCARVDCIHCHPARTAYRARSIFGKVTAALDLARRPGVRDPRLYALRVSVLTMPPELRDLFVGAADWRRLRREVWHLFRDRMGASWACIATHPVGDEEPTQFHPHLNVLWGRSVPSSAWQDLDALRAAWAEVLYRNAERIARKPLSRRETVDVWVGFVPRNEEKKLRHRARYYGRVFLGWRLWLPKAVQWYGAFPRVVPSFCPRCGVELPRAHRGVTRCECCGEEQRGVASPRAECPTCRDADRVPLFKVFAVGEDAITTFAAWQAQARGSQGPPDGG